MPAPLVRLVLVMSLLLGASTLSPTAPAVAAPGPSVAAGARAVEAPALTTTVTAHPTSISTYRTVTFAYRANLPGAKFRCRLNGPGLTSQVLASCKGGSTGDQANPSQGTTTYSQLTASREAYTFTVQAYLPAVAGGAPETTGKSAAFRWRLFTASAPDSFSPGTGASFNRPLDPRYRRTILTKVIRTIKSMPGYAEAPLRLCPRSGALVPSTIRISAYSITDAAVTNALIAAHKRCVSVQVLMNDHLDRTNDPAWRSLENALGTRVTTQGGAARRSFAHRCVSGCRGVGVLHTKMYLFDSQLLDTSKNRIRSTVATGSSNLTSNASDVQWNDLYTVRGRADLYGTFLKVFDLMKKDDGVHRRLIQVTNGPYQSTFWPQKKGAADPTMASLRSVHCTGANGGTGTGGRSLVSINMHAWFGTRGTALANQVRAMYDAGCQVRVLYSFMSYPVFVKLTRGTGARMSVRRTAFSHDGTHAYVYSHFKNISVSGHIGRDRSAKVVWTGSNNFTNDGTHFDEVMLRIASASAYDAYVAQFKSLSRTRSSAQYAHLQEPRGGGRVPRVPVGDGTVEPVQGPTISSDAITFDESGEPHAVD